MNCNHCWLHLIVISKDSNEEHQCENISIDFNPKNK